jgi:hypothetical protein
MGLLNMWEGGWRSGFIEEGSLVFGFWSLAFGLWLLVFGLWSLVFGLLAYGFWLLAFGLWSIAKVGSFQKTVSVSFANLQFFLLTP